MSWSYKKSGVDVGKAGAFVRAIQGEVRSTQGKAVLHRDGAFGGLFELGAGNLTKPVLVSSTDGVGTKLLVAQKLGIHGGVGIDLVAMNVNDILCVGAKPLFFLDYIACGQLKPKVLQTVVAGIAEGCRQSGCALIAGETAEMPDMYKKDEYDLAGFAVGVVEKRKICDGSTIRAGDIVFGFPSSGIHSNGYSLVRKVLDAAALKKHAEAVLAPTRIYAGEIQALLKTITVKGFAHNTGGAYHEKLPKIVPDGLCLSLRRESWTVPKIFHILQKAGKITDREMFRTFNMGIGMIAVIRRRDRMAASRILRLGGFPFHEIGEIVEDPKKKIQIL